MLYCIEIEKVEAHHGRENGLRSRLGQVHGLVQTNSINLVELHQLEEANIRVVVALHVIVDHTPSHFTR